MDYPSAADASDHRTDFLNLGAGLSVYDNECGARGPWDHLDSGAVTIAMLVMAAPAWPTERVRAGTRAAQA